MPKHSRRAWKQGFFEPNHPEKYTGTHPIVYRSGLEKSAMSFFDENSSVIEWRSETLIIPYIKPTDGRVHKYYTDFLVHIRDGKGIVRKFVIEVKPYKQTIPPKTGGNKKPKTLLMEQLNFAINVAKWDAAKEWCKKNGYTFSMVTEKDVEKYL